jgi:hypothetical protein
MGNVTRLSGGPTRNLESEAEALATVALTAALESLGPDILAK